MSAAETATVDRELLHSLLVEAYAVVEVLNYIGGSDDCPVVERLARLTEQAAEAIGEVPTREEWLAWTASPEVDDVAREKGHPVLEQFHEAAERRCDELLGRTEVPV